MTESRHDIGKESTTGCSYQSHQLTEVRHLDDDHDGDDDHGDDDNDHDDGHDEFEDLMS